MSEIPKGDYPPRDAEWLDTASVLSSTCIVCGARATNNHHNPPRGRFHKDDEKRVPRFSVCGMGNADGCHGLLHHNGGSVTLQPTTDTRFCRAYADERAAAQINRRRAKHGLRKVHPGIEFMCVASADDVPFEPGFDADIMDTSRREADEADQIEASGAWLKGNALKAVHDHLYAIYPTHVASKMYRDWLTSLSDPPSKSHDQRLRLFAELSSELARTLPLVKGWMVARAIGEGWDEDLAIAMAGALSVSDLEAELFGEKVKPEYQPCPACLGEPCPVCHGKRKVKVDA